MSIQGDVNEYNEIACFKPGKPLRSVLEGLKAAMAKAAKELVDPFTESDIGNDTDLVIDSNREEDEDVDIEYTLKKHIIMSLFYITLFVCK